MLLHCCRAAALLTRPPPPSLPADRIQRGASCPHSCDIRHEAWCVMAGHAPAGQPHHPGSPQGRRPAGGRGGGDDGGVAWGAVHAARWVALPACPGGMAACGAACAAVSCCMCCFSRCSCCHCCALHQLQLLMPLAAHAGLPAAFAVQITAYPPSPLPTALPPHHTHTGLGYHPGMSLLYCPLLPGTITAASKASNYTPHHTTPHP